MALWRPTGWEEIESDLDRSECARLERIRSETAAAARAARKAHNKDQGYNPNSLQNETERLARQMSPPAAHRETGKRLRVPDPRFMSDSELIAYAQALSEEHQFDWGANARPNQREPDDYETWLLLAGRGFGKSRTGAETVRKWAETPGTRYAVVARDHKTLRDVCFEGECGLTVTIPAKLWTPRDFKRGLGDVSLTLKNGSIIQGFTSHEPDALRGPAFDGMWGDEFAAWPKAQAQEVIDMFWMTSRENANAKLILTTTPKRIPHVMDMVKKATDPREKIVITRGKMEDNTSLPQAARDRLYRMFGGTRQGRQELDGELVLDLDLALWGGAMIDLARWTPDELGEPRPFPKMSGVITGVDPSGSNDGDATGIVTVGWTTADKVIYVLENKTTKGPPADRYAEACRSAHRNGSTEIWYESAYGGDNCAFGIETQWRWLQEAGEIPEKDRCPLIRPSTIKGDKAARAMPVVARYEQQMNLGNTTIVHPEPTPENGIAELEEEMLTWETDSKKSPNAIDAMVHATRQIMKRIGLETTLSRPSPKRRIPRGYQHGR